MPHAAPHPGAYGPNAYGPAAYGPSQAMGRDPRLLQLDSDANMWLIVGLVGFFTGFGWITGPLCWIKGGGLRRQYANFGLPASSSATGAWIVGLVSTALAVMAVLSVILLFVVWGGIFAVMS